MKHYIKILMVLFFVSCAADPIEDMGNSDPDGGGDSDSDSDSDSDADSDGDSDTGTGSEPPGEGWLYTSGNEIKMEDGDGNLEVVVGSAKNHYIYCVYKNGGLRWKYQTGDQVISSPAIADLDGDGKLEVVVGSLDRKLYCLNKDGQTFVSSKTQGKIRPRPWPMFHRDLKHSGSL